VVADGQELAAAGGVHHRSTAVADAGPGHAAGESRPKAAVQLSCCE
jgi:hypothetical protein